MKLFIDAGVDVNAETQWGTTAYSLALERDMDDKLSLLLEAGAVENTTQSPWLKKKQAEDAGKSPAMPDDASEQRHPVPQEKPKRPWWKLWG